MENSDFEKKFREFMEKELPGFTYQAAISATNGKIGNEGKLQIKTYVIGFDTRKTPFAIAHSLFRTLEAGVNGMLQGVYGTTLKTENANAIQGGGQTMHR